METACENTMMHLLGLLDILPSLRKLLRFCGRCENKVPCVYSCCPFFKESLKVYSFKQLTSWLERAFCLKVTGNFSEFLPVGALRRYSGSFMYPFGFLALVVETYLKGRHYKYIPRISTSSSIIISSYQITYESASASGCADLLVCYDAQAQAKLYCVDLGCLQGMERFLLWVCVHGRGMAFGS
jgi:hypothetical protein